MWAIVPVKTFDRAKQRLANVLSEAERRSLMLAMARDVLTCLSKCTQLSGILIVSRASEADALAQTFNTERFNESPECNLAEALEQATRYLVDHFNAQGVIVAPADVPCIEPAELDGLIAAHTDITIIPDADNIGTNALIVSPPLRIPYIFDGQSLKPHTDAAYAAGIAPRIVPGTRFALDIDLPQDLLAVCEHATETQTANYLMQHNIIDRVQTAATTHSG